MLNVVDADSHVEESDATWAYLDAEFADRRPRVVQVPDAPWLMGFDALWWIDGHTYPRPRGRGATIYSSPPLSTRARGKRFSVESQSLSDLGARLHDLDRFGLDLQVLFPTVFLEPLTADVRFEAALMRSYNTWIAERCAASGGRLKHVAVMPLRSPHDAVAEARRAAEQGAVGLAVYGTAGDMLLHDRALDPFYAEAERLRLPVCVHVGWSHPGLNQSADSIYSAQMLGFTLPVLMGFFSIVGGGVLDRFPALKVGFFEAGIGWLPYWIERMDHYYHVDAPGPVSALPARPPSEYLRGGQLYFTCEGDERLLSLALELVGDDHVMGSADMPHSELRENTMEEIRERADLADATKQKLLAANAIRFFNL
ncbi:MAG TPA: amidohydrolase family protein [Chloroflexota bacterium]|nr:amidohydrolase family protein [Chloroflexota bacterium]